MDKSASKDRKALLQSEIARVGLEVAAIKMFSAICQNEEILNKNMTWMRSCYLRTWSFLTMTIRIIQT